MSYNKNNKNNGRIFKTTKLERKNVRSFFVKLALISFIPVAIIAIALSIALKGQNEWIIWLVSAVLLIICFSVGYYVLMKKERQKEEDKQNKNKGKKKYNTDDVDIYS